MEHDDLLRRLDADGCGRDIVSVGVVANTCGMGDRCEWCEQRREAAARIRELEAQSEGRLVTLLAKAEELRAEWKRAENAEGRAEAAEAKVADLQQQLYQQRVKHGDIIPMRLAGKGEVKP